MDGLEDLALARRVHENVVACFALAGEEMEGGHVARLDGAIAAGTPLPILLFNQVLVVDGDASNTQTAESIRAGVAIFRGFEKRFAVTLRGGLDDAYLPLLRELGLAPLPDSPWMPGMALHPLPPIGSHPLPPGHEIRAVTSMDALADHAAALAAGFEMPRDWADAFCVEAMLHRPELAFYVGYQDGEPVTSGLGLRTGATIGVYNIATVPSARRHGYGAAMTMRIVDDGAAAGCDVAILQSSTMGQPVYERLGFRTVSEYFGYIEAASLHG